MFLSVPEELVSSEMKTEEEVIADCVGIYLHILGKKKKKVQGRLLIKLFTVFFFLPNLSNKVYSN